MLDNINKAPKAQYLATLFLIKQRLHGAVRGMDKYLYVLHFVISYSLIFFLIFDLSHSSTNLLEFTGVIDAWELRYFTVKN